MSSRCNGCDLERLREQYGERLVHVRGSWYVRGESPAPGHGDPLILAGVPCRFLVWFMSTGHACGKTSAEDKQFHGEEYHLPARR
jgi:hypothetical protein